MPARAQAVELGEVLRGPLMEEVRERLGPKLEELVDHGVTSAEEVEKQVEKIGEILLECLVQTCLEQLANGELETLVDVTRNHPDLIDKVLDIRDEAGERAYERCRDLGSAWLEKKLAALDVKTEGQIAKHYRALMDDSKPRPS